MKKLMLVVVPLAMMLLAGCAANQSPVFGADPNAGTQVAQPLFDNAEAQRQVFQAKQRYLEALTVAEAYVKLPACGKSQPPCATISVVRQIQQAQPVARQALDAAESAVRNKGFGQDIQQTAVAAGLASLRAFVTITATLNK